MGPNRSRGAEGRGCKAPAASRLWTCPWPLTSRSGSWARREGKRWPGKAPWPTPRQGVLWVSATGPGETPWEPEKGGRLFPGSVCTLWMPTQAQDLLSSGVTGPRLPPPTTPGSPRSLSAVHTGRVRFTLVSGPLALHPAPPSALSASSLLRLRVSPSCRALAHTSLRHRRPSLWPPCPAGSCLWGLLGSSLIGPLKQPSLVLRGRRPVRLLQHPDRNLSLCSSPCLCLTPSGSVSCREGAGGGPTLSSLLWPGSGRRLSQLTKGGPGSRPRRPSLSFLGATIRSQTRPRRCRVVASSGF